MSYSDIAQLGSYVQTLMFQLLYVELIVKIHQYASDMLELDLPIKDFD